MKHCLRIGGFVELSTVDIPKRACSVVFFAGCNFDCIFCQNSSLIPLNSGDLIELKKLIDDISKNILIDSVSITGGEPLLQSALIPLCQELKKNFYVSIDTNGSVPKVVEQLVDIVNRVALDLKCEFKRYIDITCAPSHLLGDVEKSFSIINSSSITDFEVRTTIVPGLIGRTDVNAISRYLTNHNFRGVYVLQQFWNEGDVRELKKINSPTKYELIELAKMAIDQGVDNVAIRTRSHGYEFIS
ncbi:MAG: anaerobic ribonucleoside-triphosphate reductase activating protein [Candidatus Sifarchaeia archaeon]|jgi:pyruvate formate lyase activating enzyme